MEADIAEYGWHCLHVLPREGEDHTPFTYSIPVTETLRHPEIAIFGLSRETAHAILADCANDIRAGTRYVTDKPLAGVLGGDVRVIFKCVRKDRMREYFGTATRHYKGTDFEVWVMFWPSKDGRFPWEGFDTPLQAEALDVV
jgi:hypothetical protein